MTPPPAIDLAGEDLASGPETWTELPCVGETAFSAGGLRRGTDYLHARFRSPLTGRFLSVDPAAPDAHNPQSWNRYAYVFGNPLKYTDPTGLTAQKSFFDRTMEWIKGKLDEWFPTPETQPNPAAQALLEEGELQPFQVNEFDTGGTQAKTQEALKDATAMMGAGVVTAGGEVAASATVGRVVRILSPGGSLIGATGSRASVRELPGGSKAALELFGRLAKGGERVRDTRYPGVMVRMADDAFIGYRPVSRSGPATIDVNIPGVAIDKIKFLE